jgi:hypothetical protein
MGMHWFFKFLTFAFVVFLVGYNLSFADSAFLTLDVAGTIGYVMAVMVVLAAVVRAGLNSVVLASPSRTTASPSGTRVPIVMEEKDNVAARRAQKARTRYQAKPVEEKVYEKTPAVEEEEVIVYEKTPSIEVVNGVRNYRPNKRMPPKLHTRGVHAKTRCACGMSTGDRCMCDLQKRAAAGVTRSPFAAPSRFQPRDYSRTAEYSLTIASFVSTPRTVACTIEVEGTCLDISVDVPYNTAKVVDHITCRPTRLRINNVPKPIWFDLPFSDTNRNMRVTLNEDDTGLYVERDANTI